LPTLHRVLEALRQVERRRGMEGSLLRWLGVRGTLHQVLAARGSTVALYDVRETFERATEPLPEEFVETVAAIGDKACLAALAAAYAAAPRAPAAEDWWRGALARAFQSIVRREALTERHGAIKHVRARWPEAARALLGPPRRLRH
jgi:hypothetical protein